MKTILARLLQVSTWVGIALIVSAFLAPRSFIVFLGLVLMFTDDETLKSVVAKCAPGVIAKLEEWTK